MLHTDSHRRTWLSVNSAVYGVPEVTRVAEIETVHRLLLNNIHDIHGKP